MYLGLKQLVKGVMPPVCAKCRQSTPLEGDSWCAACSAWEALGRDLSATWELQGCRTLASDLVVNCVRQVRALRNLGAGLTRPAPLVGDSGGSHHPEAGTSRARSEVPGLSAKAASKAGPLRAELPRRRSSEARAVKDERSEGDEDDEEEAEESEELPPSPVHRPIPDKHQKPPEPDHSPPTDRRREGGRKRDRENEGPREKREKVSGRDRRRRRGGHRAGRKHQRLYRLAVDPTLPIHRKPSEDFWTLTSIAQGDQALHRY